MAQLPAAVYKWKGERGRREFHEAKATRTSLTFEDSVEQLHVKRGEGLAEHSNDVVDEAAVDHLHARTGHSKEQREIRNENNDLKGKKSALAAVKRLRLF